MKKNRVFLLGILVMVLALGMTVVGCVDHDNTGFQVEYYEITSAILGNRPSGVTPEAHLSYVKRASGNNKKGDVWLSSYEAVEKKIREEGGISSISDASKTAILGQYTSVVYTNAIFSPEMFFYIKNNYHK